MSRRVLIVEDEPRLRSGLVELLRDEGYEVAEAASLAEARDHLAADRSVDGVLLDLRLPDGDGIELLRELRGTPVVVATAFSDARHTIEAMREGAYDYVTKPFELPRLLEVLARATRGTAVASLPDASERTRLVGQSEPMLQVWKQIGRAARATAPVLLLGETGTGKDVVAREIHAWSGRPGAFVAVNVAALAPGLLESELFGHVRGAYTGAERAREGRVAQADGGTLFLDEIGDLDPQRQTVLLRLLESRTYERVGSDEVRHASARVVAATARPVHPGDPEAALREDLYYRLAGIEIALPPLRERRSDIPALVAHALQSTAASAVSEDAMALLQGHGWPGNVRELFHVVGRAAAMAGSDVIEAEDLPPLVRAAEPDMSDTSLDAVLRRTERDLVEAALREADGNRAAAARRLGISRPRLYARLKALGLSREA